MDGRDDDASESADRRSKGGALLTAAAGDGCDAAYVDHDVLVLGKDVSEAISQGEERGGHGRSQEERSVNGEPRHATRRPGVPRAEMIADAHLGGRDEPKKGSGEPDETLEHDVVCREGGLPDATRDKGDGGEAELLQEGHEELRQSLLRKAA